MLEELERKIRNGGSLSEDETRYLFSQLHKDPDRIRHLIASGNMGLVRRETARFRRSPEYEDLIQEGFLTLYDAIRHYDPLNSAPFAVYAGKCIRNRLKGYLHREGRLISLPWYAHGKKGYEMQKKAVVSLDIRVPAGDGWEGEVRLMDLLPSEESLEEQVLQRAQLESVLEVLPKYLTPRERDILCDRYGLCGRPEQSRTEIRNKYHYSRQYVSAVEKHALRKLRERLVKDDES